MRLPFALIGSAAVIGLASAANAGFTGYQVETFQIGNTWIMNVYAGFSNSGDRVFNVYNTNISTNHAGGFYQAAANPFWKPATNQNKNTSVDSWVTIGTNPNGNGNSSGSIVAGDPSFVNFDDSNDSTDFSVIESSGTGAGWYNNNPGNLWGYADQGGNRVLLAHFAFAPNQGGGNTVFWSALLTIRSAGSTQAETVGGGNFQFFIPGPGALALLGVAGLASRRRRA
jgi:hypothetical protein